LQKIIKNNGLISFLKKAWVQLGWYDSRPYEPSQQNPVSRDRTERGTSAPVIIPRSEHVISRNGISPNAVKVLYRLKNAGYQAYLVGGGVRDLLLGREPKDFDIATDAHPEDVRQLFRNCRLIGRRFRLAHVVFGREVIEVATFRAFHEQEDEVDGRQTDEGRILRDNVYGSIEDDAWRRDFSVNALYYNIGDFSVVDYTGGMADLKAGLLRLIGDPEQRFREDAVRMLRAVRFAVKLGFLIEERCERKMLELAPLLGEIPAARLYEEVLKLFLSGYGLEAFEKLRHYGLFAQLFPLTEKALEREEQHFPLTLVTRALENTDARIAEDKPVTPAFLFAALLWEPMRQRYEALQAEGLPPLEAMQVAGNEIVSQQAQAISIPKRFTLPMREIWTLQARLEQRQGKRPLRLLGHPRFRAAYDFLLLRCASGEAPAELGEWWTEFQTLNPDEQVQAAGPAKTAKKRRRRPRKPRGATGEGQQ
jgi:poly(A) polymerase